MGYFKPFAAVRQAFGFRSVSSASCCTACLQSYAGFPSGQLPSRIKRDLVGTIQDQLSRRLIRVTDYCLVIV